MGQEHGFARIVQAGADGGQNPGNQNLEVLPVARVRAGVGFEHGVPWHGELFGFGLHGVKKQGVAIHGFYLETVNEFLLGPMQVAGRHGEHEKRTLFLRVTKFSSRRKASATSSESCFRGSGELIVRARWSDGVRSESLAALPRAT
jgi:hypothetical protein